MDNVPDELKDWDEIIKAGESDLQSKRDLASLRGNKKLVLAIANLGLYVFNLQKVLGSRMDNLEHSINRFNNESSKLYKIYIWLTVVIALATVANVLIAIFQK